MASPGHDRNLCVRTDTKRETWIDLAKGGAILLVVQYHATNRAMHFGDIPELIMLFNQLLAQVRMPLFFFCSGMAFAYASATRRELFVPKRLVQLGYIYLLWALILVLFHNHVTYLNHMIQYQVTDVVRAATIEPIGPIWFVFALILGSAFAWLVQGANVAASVALCVFLFVSGTLDLSGVRVIDKSLQFLPFFWVPARFGPRIMSLLWAHRLSVTVGAGILFALLAGVEFVELVPGSPYLDFVRSAAGVIAAVGVASFVAAIPLLARPLLFFGSKSLPIFLMHVPIQASLLAFTPLSSLQGPSFILGYWLIVIASVGLPIAIYEAIKPTRLRVLIDPPKESLNRVVTKVAGWRVPVTTRLKRALGRPAR